MKKETIIPWSDVLIDDNRAAIPGEDARLMASISANGLICRITLTALPDGKYRVCAGRRRAKALRYLFPDGLRPEWYDLTDAPDVVSYEENANRQSLTLAEDVAQLRALAALPGMTVDRLAAKLGRSPRTIARRLKIAELPDETIRLSEKGVTMETLEKLAVMSPEERDNVSEWNILCNRVERRVRPLPPGGWCADCAGCAHRSDDADGLLFEPEELGCRNVDCWQGHFGAMLAEAARQARADGLRVCWAAKRESALNFSIGADVECCLYVETVEGGWTPDEDDDEDPGIEQHEYLVISDTGYARELLHVADEFRPEPPEPADEAEAEAEADDGGTRGKVKLAAEIQEAEEKLRKKRDGWMRDQLRATFSSVEAIAASCGGRGIMIRRLRDRAWHALFYPNWHLQPHKTFGEFRAEGLTDPAKCDAQILELFQFELAQLDLETLCAYWILDVDLKKLAAEARTKVPAPKKLTELKAELKRLKNE